MQGVALSKRLAGGSMRYILWSRFNGVSNSTAARMTVLIPLFAYLILFNDKVSQYLHLVRELGGNPDGAATVPPKLMLIYFGLCAIALGVTIYGWFCPAGVKFYGSPNAYVAGIQESVKDFAFEELEDELRKSDYKRDYIRIRERYEKTNPPNLPLTDEQKAQVNNGILHLYYKYLNSKYPFARAVLAALYLIGFGCLLYPSLGVFWRVSKILYRTIVNEAGALF
jgi:hypothetical protein